MDALNPLLILLIIIACSALKCRLHWKQAIIRLLQLCSGIYSYSSNMIVMMCSRKTCLLQAFRLVFHIF